jgi:NADP-reducing hydrogenase subunit HndC
MKGAEWFRSIGTEKTPGTKVFTMLGDINNQGLIEVPMGITLREVIYGVGGGIPNGRGFKLAQTGGTSGGCLPKEFLDLPMDYDSLAAAGSALGSGALLVIDDSHCIVDVLRSFMKFFQHESCGQCTPCREGTYRLYQLFSALATGEAGLDAINLIKELCQTMQLSSLCGLGQSAPNGVVTALQYFEEEIQRHAAGECPAGVCRTNAIGSRAV